MATKSNPKPESISRLRMTVQERNKSGITKAKDDCAESLYTTRRVWDQWEKGDRKMHPAFWELVLLKLDVEEADVDNQEKDNERWGMKRRSFL